MTIRALLLARGIRFWILARLLVVVLLAFLTLPGGAGTAADPAMLLLLTPPAALLVVALTAALGLVEVARRRERALLGNFGISHRRAAAWLAAPAAVGEVAVALAAAVVIGLAR